MQNASNEKRKVSTNYLSGNHRLSVRVHATATPVQAAHVRTERTIVNEPAKRRCVSPAPRKQLHFQEQSTMAETGVLTGKTKSSRQPETTSIPVTSESLEFSTGRKHLQASIRSWTKDIFPSSGLSQRRENETGCPQPKWHHVISVLQAAASQKCYHRIFQPRTKTNVPEASRKKHLSTDVWDG